MSRGGKPVAPRQSSNTSHDNEMKNLINKIKIIIIYIIIIK